MAIFIRPKRWTQKPSQPILNFGHPLSKGAKVVIPFSEMGQSVASGSLAPSWRELVRFRPIQAVTGSGNVSQVQTQGGSGVNVNNTDLSIPIGADNEITIPTARATVLIIRRKTDATNRASSMFGAEGATGTEIFNCHCPFSDGNVYWDFGGNTSPNRLSFTPASVAGVQKWAFVAGSKGSAIYLNGIKQASQSTAISRTNAGATFAINNGAAGAGDLADYYFFAVLDAEWTQDMVQWWNAEPYAMFSSNSSVVRTFGTPFSGFTPDEDFFSALQIWPNTSTVSLW